MPVASVAPTPQPPAVATPQAADLAAGARAAQALKRPASDVLVGAPNYGNKFRSVNYFKLESF